MGKFDKVDMHKKVCFGQREWPMSKCRIRDVQHGVWIMSFLGSFPEAELEH